MENENMKEQELWNSDEIKEKSKELKISHKQTTMWAYPFEALQGLFQSYVNVNSLTFAFVLHSMIAVHN